ncbi:MAG: AAA family ATPase [Patescibacteria group bacterium]|nr:AAA family ATPase [Patescibacteria group bacterium]
MPKNNKIIAIIGMAGSGKSAAVDYIQKQHHWPKVYLGQPTFDRLKKEGLKRNYKNERIVREKTRRELGMGAYAKLMMPQVKKLLKTSRIILIESLYSWDEYKIFKKKFGKDFLAVAVTAPSYIRLARLKERPIRPIKTAAELMKRDWTEIEGTDKGGPIAAADYTVINDGSVEKLKKNIDLIIKTI